jgi:hypothetical protein
LFRAILGPLPERTRIELAVIAKIGLPVDLVILIGLWIRFSDFLFVVGLLSSSRSGLVESSCRKVCSRRNSGICNIFSD